MLYPPARPPLDPLKTYRGAPGVHPHVADKGGEHQVVVGAAIEEAPPGVPRGATWGCATWRRAIGRLDRSCHAGQGGIQVARVAEEPARDQEGVRRGSGGGQRAASRSPAWLKSLRGIRRGSGEGQEGVRGRHPGRLRG